MHSPRPLAQKGRLRTLSSTFESRKFEFSKKIQQRNVHVRCIISMPQLAFCIISLGVGCRVAYPWKRQCESLDVG